MNFGGDYRTPFLGRLTHYVNKCSKETEILYNITCLPFDASKNPVDFFISFFTSDSVFDPSNYEKPTHIRYGYKYENIDLKNMTNIFRLNYAISTVTTDAGVFFSDPVSREFINFDSIQNIIINGLEKNKIAKVFIYLTNKNQYHHRTYIKIPEIIAEVGGVLQLMIPAFQLFLNIFINNNYNLYLYHFFFKIQKEDEDSNQNQNHKLNHLDEIGVVFHKNNQVEKININAKEETKKENVVMRNIENSAEVIDKSQEIIINKEIQKEITSKTNRKLSNYQITECNRLIYTCCNGKSKRDTTSLLLSNLEEELTKKLDYIGVLRMMDQFRLIKKLVLNEGQSLMLNKRELQIVSEKVKSSGELDDNSYIQQIEEYIKSRKENRLWNQVDILLLNYLEKEIREKIKICDFE